MSNFFRRIFGGGRGNREEQDQPSDTASNPNQTAYVDALVQEYLEKQHIEWKHERGTPGYVDDLKKSNRAKEIKEELVAMGEAILPALEAVQATVSQPDQRQAIEGIITDIHGLKASSKPAKPEPVIEKPVPTTKTSPNVSALLRTYHANNVQFDPRERSMYKSDAAYKEAERKFNEAKQIYKQIVAMGIDVIPDLETAATRTKVTRERNAIKTMISAIKRQHREETRPKIDVTEDDLALALAAVGFKPDGTRSPDVDRAGASKKIQAKPADYITALFAAYEKISRLPDRDPLIRFIDSLPLEAVTPAVLELLSGEDEKILAQALHYCGRHTITEAVDPILSIVSYNKNNKVMTAAVHALGSLGDPKAFEILCSLVESDNTSIQRAALSNISKLGDPRAVDVVLPHVESSDNLVRTGVLRSLGTLMDDDRVYQVLSDAIKQGNKQSLTAVVDTVSPHAIADTRSMELIVALITHENKQIRRRITEQLQHNDAVNGDPKLHEALRNNIQAYDKGIMMFIRKLADFNDPDDAAFLREVAAPKISLKSSQKELDEIIERLES